MKPQRFGPEWWALFSATWALARRSSTSVSVQQADKTYVTTEITTEALARFCMREADAALTAFGTVSPP